MKKSDLNKMLGLIDDDILNEARPSGKRPKSKTSMWLKIVSAAACFLLILNVALVPTALYMNGKISSLVDELDGKNQLIDNIFNGAGDTSPDTVPEESEKNPPIYVQNVLELPIGKNNDKTVLLSSPLLSASSKYEDIINSIIQSSPNLDKENVDQDAMDKNESMGDLENELEDAMENLGESKDEYHETTDLQVKGVIEGDIIKRSSKYIYYLSGSKLKIYSIDKQNSELVALYSIEKHIEALNEALKIPEQLHKNDDTLQDKEEIYDAIERVEDVYYTSVKEMFLSRDLKTVTIVIQNRVSVNVLDDNKWDIMLDEYNDALYCTTLLSLNVEDPDAIYLNNLTTVFGAYESARLVGDSFLLFTKYTPIANELIIPQYNDGEGFKHIPRENIYSPNKYHNGSYLISYQINSGSYDVSDVYAYASYDGEIYVTSNSIYVTRQYNDKKTFISEYPIYLKDVVSDKTVDPDAILGYGKKTIVSNKIATDILRIDISSGTFVPVGAVSVDGYIKDRYSLHENGEYFYVVTTDSPARQYTYYENEYGLKDYGYDYDIVDVGTSANLFVIDNETMALISSVIRFAPNGETVRSVRFDGYNAYVCTAVLNTDPVFFFNLSDPHNITYSDTGTIPGFSTSLIELPNGELLGIGTDNDGYVKLEVYRMAENNTVVIVATMKIKASSYSTDYKTYFIDRENGYFGIGYNDRKREDGERYALVKYENGYFTLILDREISGTLGSKRAVMIDGYFYILSSEDFKVVYVK